jgi:hypothetical protein
MLFHFRRYHHKFTCTVSFGFIESKAQMYRRRRLTFPKDREIEGTLVKKMNRFHFLRGNRRYANALHFSRANNPIVGRLKKFRLYRLGQIGERRVPSKVLLWSVSVHPEWKGRTINSPNSLAFKIVPLMIIALKMRSSNADRSTSLVPVEFDVLALRIYPGV